MTQCVGKHVPLDVQGAVLALVVWHYDTNLCPSSFTQTLARNNAALNNSGTVPATILPFKGVPRSQKNALP
jgi:hypothetical protein